MAPCITARHSPRSSPHRRTRSASCACREHTQGRKEGEACVRGAAAESSKVGQRRCPLLPCRVAHLSLRDPAAHPAPEPACTRLHLHRPSPSHVSAAHLVCLEVREGDGRGRHLPQRRHAGVDGVHAAVDAVEQVGARHGVALQLAELGACTRACVGAGRSPSISMTRRAACGRVAHRTAPRARARDGQRRGCCVLCREGERETDSNPNDV